MATETHADRSLVPGIDRPAAVTTARTPFNARRLVGNIGFLALLLFFTLLFIYPFIWLISASLKPGAEELRRQIDQVLGTAGVASRASSSRSKPSRRTRMS